ncbi:MAG: potassium channel family protein, partial [Vicinamibacterales bacterium]
MLTPWQRLAIGCFAAVALACAGIIGYMAIEGLGFFDAVYQTITTITTAGFGEVEPLSNTGRAFTLVLILVGVLVILYVLTCVMQIAVEGEIESLLGARRVRGQIRGLRDHHVICGFGRVGEAIASELLQRKERFVIVEDNPAAIARARRKRYLLVEGDATSDVVLRDAGIASARSLLAASDSDTGNTFIVLTARSVNPNLFIVARAAQPET